MKLYSPTLLPAIDKATLKKLTAVTRETLDVVPGKKRKLTTADLWYIQKRKREFSTRRFL